MAEIVQPKPPFPWLVGEHVTAIGDTGTGKTYLLAKLVRMRRYVVVFKTKGDPDDEAKWRGFFRAAKAKAMDNIRHEHILLDPEYKYQAREGYEMLERAYVQGNWTIVIDELWMAERIGLKAQIEKLLTQGRSKGISVVLGQQRPVTTSRFAISQSTHLFSFRVEGRDGKTIAESTTPRILPVLDSLTGHDFAYYNRAHRYVGTGNAGRLGNIIVPSGYLQKSVAKPIDKGVVAAEAGT
jgi:hypothetical protein